MTQGAFPGDLSRRRIRWWILLFAIPIVAIATWNAYSVLRAFIHLAVVWDGSAIDWHHLRDASRLANPFEQDEFRWSPVAAWLLKPITALGLTGWRAAQVAAVLTIRDWRVVAVILISAPFWVDVMNGDGITFVMVAAWHALAGSRAATLSYLALSMLMPRPLMLPVLAWLLWKRPETRVWFVAIAGAHAALVLASGLALHWGARLLATGAELNHINNIAPSHWIGWAWVPIGLGLAVWLTWRGRLGLASIAASPYVFPYYLLMLVLELRPRNMPTEAVPAAPRRRPFPAGPGRIRPPAPPLSGQ